MKNFLRQSDATPGCSRPRRSAFSMVELVVSVMLLGTVFLTVGALLTWVRHARSLADQRLIAVTEVSNLAERLELIRPEDLTEDRLAEVELSAVAEAGLRNPRLTARMDEEAGPPAAKRVTLELRWEDAGGRIMAPARLVVWRFPEREETP